MISGRSKSCYKYMVLILLFTFFKSAGFAAECFRLQYGISKTEAIFQLKKDNIYVDNSGNYVLATYKLTDPDNYSLFNDKGEKHVFAMYVFSKNAEKLNRCILFSIISETRMANRKILEGMVSVYMKSRPIAQDNKNGLDLKIWERGDTVVDLYELAGMIYVDFKLLFIDYDKSAPEIIMENSSWVGG
ncbi:MAG: hypothetical protein HQ556_07120 [Candidatus Marinimicrobia bacterium]|nr:hypothetical protein [Candidatus Neomarinimicrobiota bacterium]